MTPSPYTKRHPIVIRAASREAALVRAAQHGWPAFLGVFGSDIRHSAAIYRRALAAANHPADVVETCLRWCTVDWISVTVADTDAEALRREKLAQAEQLEIRKRFVSRFGKVDGPVVRPTPGQRTADAYAKGGDMRETIVGSPDTVADRLQELVDAGVNHVHIRFLGEWLGETRHVCEASAKLFAKEVMPRFIDVQPLHDPMVEIVPR